MTAITLPVEDYTPIYVGDTASYFAPVFVDATNTPIPLTGATLSTRMTNQYGVTKVWTSGNWVIDDATNGKAHYQYLSADVDTAGSWSVQTDIVIGGLPKHTDVKLLVILPTV